MFQSQFFFFFNHPSLTQKNRDLIYSSASSLDRNCKEEMVFIFCKSLFSMASMQRRDQCLANLCFYIAFYVSSLYLFGTTDLVDKSCLNCRKGEIAACCKHQLCSRSRTGHSQWEELRGPTISGQRRSSGVWIVCCLNVWIGEVFGPIQSTFNHRLGINPESES